MFILGRRSRVVFAASWIVLQGALVITGSRRADGAFAFRMFPESSTIHISLSRTVVSNETPIHVTNGGWTARDDNGNLQNIAWTDRVKDPVLSNLDRTVSASYGSNAQLTRLQAALNDVAVNLANDAETTQFIADVTVTHNGSEPFLVTLKSARRTMVR